MSTAARSPASYVVDVKWLIFFVRWRIWLTREEVDKQLSISFLLKKKKLFILARVKTLLSI